MQSKNIGSSWFMAKWKNVFAQCSKAIRLLVAFNPIQDGGGAKKVPLLAFPLCLLQTFELAPKTFLTFSFNPFAKLV